MIQERCVLDDVYDYIRRFVSFSGEEELASVVAFAAHTHLVDAFYIIPRLTILSAEKRSGKSRLLEILKLLVQSPVKASGPSAAGLYSVPAVAKQEGKPTPTLLLDEVGRLFERVDTGDIVTMINEGFQRGATILKGTYINGKRGSEELDAFCPMVLAGIDKGKIPDDILDRSVIIRMKRRKKREKYRPRYHAQEGLELGKRLAAWGKENLERAKAMWPKLPSGLEDRLDDIWEPLFISAACAGCDGSNASTGWASRIEQAALAALNEQEDIEQTEGTVLLRDIRDHSIQIADKWITTENLLDALYKRSESPWADYAYGRPLTAKRLADILRPYEIYPRKRRIGTETQRGYYLPDFEDAWEIWLSDTPYTAVLDAANGTSVTEVDAIEKDLGLVALVAPVSDTPPTAVTSVTDDTADTEVGLVEQVGKEYTPQKGDQLISDDHNGRVYLVNTW
jgi:Protein of unknown function (DUF3631)